MSDDEQLDDELDELDDDEVLTPEVVDQPRTRGGAAKRSVPDKFGRWSMYAGIASTILLVLFPVMVFVLALACAGIYFGMRTRRDIDEAEEPEQARKRAKIGTGFGAFTLIALLGLVIFFNFFFHSPDKVNDFNNDKPAAEAG